MKAVQIGVIAEEQNDVDVLYEFTSKLIAENKFKFSKFVGHGCGMLRRKCGAWAKNLASRGCTHLVVMHDLDNRNEAELRRELCDAIKKFDNSLILIPILELEAWLLCDAVAIKKTFGVTKHLKTPANPERVVNPKEKLRDIVYKSCKKRYINTIHNKKIAAAIQVKHLKACSSFSSYPNFIKESVRK